MSGKFSNNPVITRYEYGKQIEVPDRKELELYLFSLWDEHKDIWSAQLEDETNEKNRKYQPFLNFDGELARARNYVGFIHFQNLKLEIYPKVFRNSPQITKKSIHNHLFYWFSYCKKVIFPFNQAFLDGFEINELPELIIYLFANQIHEVVSNCPYSAYEEVQEALFTPKGRINFNRYTNTISYGNYHRIDCDYEPFIFDNTLNRIIKYCVRLLLSKTTVAENQRLLNEIIFVLDEVDDQYCSVEQLECLRLSSIYSDYEEVIHICRMILENQVYSYSDYEMKNWSLLFPMEIIFEQFIAGYIQTHFSDKFKVEIQKSDLYLHNDPKAFNLQHDILLTNRETKEQIIIDTKYKPRWDLENSDSKKGIKPSDMYQMISYAYRRGTDKVILIYPNTSDTPTDDSVFLINNGFTNEKIKVKAVDVPFWSVNGKSYVEENLKKKLGKIINSDF